jgi:hypothetical protein
MQDLIINVLVCEGEEFDHQSSILFSFDNWEEAVKFIKLSLKNELIILVNSPKE